MDEPVIETVPTFGMEEFGQFLLERGLAKSEKQAVNFARSAMRNLLWIGLPFMWFELVCQKCRKAPGRCCCRTPLKESFSAGEYAVEWRLKPGCERNWRVTHASLFNFTVDHLAHMSKPARERIVAYRDHVRAQT